MKNMQKRKKTQKKLQICFRKQKYLRFASKLMNHLGFRPLQHLKMTV